MTSTAQPAGVTLRTLIVDDEPLARARLQALLAELRQPVVEVVAQAGSAQEALQLAQRLQPDLLLLDIHMPGMDGMELARQLRRQRPDCLLVFVTAYGEHALEAFDVAATDYLTKPVRRERLQAALDKAWAQLAASRSAAAGSSANVAAWMQKVVGAHSSPPAPRLSIHERGQIQRNILVADILYAKAELKYVTLFLRQQREVIWDGSLNQLEEQYGDMLLRIHRSTLVQKNAMMQCKKCLLPDGGEGWLLQLQGVSEWLQVSRRMLPAVRQAMAAI